MRKRTFFNSHRHAGWPDPKSLERFFLAPPGKEWFYSGGNDSARLVVEGLHGTEHRPAHQGRVDADLMMWGNPKLGVLLIYSKWGGGYRETFSSKGDLTRLGELVRNLHDTPLPVGLFIPFAKAWSAVKEFIETEGELPKTIEWIANSNLPPSTFPDP